MGAATSAGDHAEGRPAGRASRGRRLLRGLVAVIALVVVAASAWFAIPRTDLPEARAALAGTPTVGVASRDGHLVFTPTSAPPSTGLILYPGGKVDAAAYAPTAAAIAEHGFLVEIVSMPLNLAVLDIDAATGVMAAHPEIRHWAVGGHSLGGAMAAQYLGSHPGSAEGLVLWAAYSAVPLAGDADPDVRTLLVYGSLDAGAAGYVSPEHLANLGAPPTIVVIEGGNHEQMGWYTGQPDDPPATISRSDQQARLVDATRRFLETLGS